MNPQDAIDFSREAIKTCMMIGGPILLASLVVGLLVGAFQAMTQVQDQTVSFVPKILLLILTISLMLPWCTDHLLDFAKVSFETPMTHWSGAPTGSAVEATPVGNKLTNMAPTLATRQVKAPELLAPATRIAQASFPLTAGANSASRVSATEGSEQTHSFSMPQMQPQSGTLSSPTMPTLKPRPEFDFNLTPGNPKSSSPFQAPHYRSSKSPRNDIGG